MASSSGTYPDQLERDELVTLVKEKEQRFAQIASAVHLVDVEVQKLRKEVEKLTVAIDSMKVKPGPVANRERISLTACTRNDSHRSEVRVCSLCGLIGHEYRNCNMRLKFNKFLCNEKERNWVCHNQCHSCKK